MKCLALFLFALPAATGQTPTASITGTVLDMKTQKPVPAALVIAIQSGPVPFSRNTRAGADGAFQIRNLPPGKFSLCIQTPSHSYLDPCEWNGSPMAVTLVSGQAASGISIKLTPASTLSVRVQDAQKTLNQLTKDGRRADLTVGVWGPKGIYYPARVSPVPLAENLQAGQTTYSYQIAVPRDTALKLYVASRDLKLGDATGAALSGNKSQQSFQHTTGEANPKSFAFTVLGLLP